MNHDRKFKVLMISSESVPFAKTGGLADMVGSLSTHLADKGHDVRLVLPRYYFIDTERYACVKHPAPMGVPIGGKEEWTAIFETTIPGSKVPTYMLDHEGLFGRDGIYGWYNQSDFPDNVRRFALLCRGAFQLCRSIGWIPDIIHAHDWPSALAPVYLYTAENAEEFKKTASLFTIHNLGYQGLSGKDTFPDTGLPWENYHTSGLEYFGGVNLLQSALKCSDILTTVSPTYAREIQTPEYGCRLDGLLRHRSADLYGVLNGMDYDAWNPETDKFLPAPFSAADLAGKATCKAELQRRAGLAVDPEIPLVGIVSRLAEQKGFGALCGPSHGSLYSMCQDFKVQVVVLGTGEKWCEDELRYLSQRLPNLRAFIEFSNPLAHLIEGGADFFLMPSQYEPCGLNQLYSLRYGTLPIVRRTGGLADTVVQYDQSTGDGTGFLFDDLSPHALYNVVGWAVWTWFNKPEYIRKMRQAAMEARFTWDESAAHYVELYQWAIDRRVGKWQRSW